MIQEIIFNSFGGMKKENKIRFNQGLNIIHGQNEAGKSTLFNSIQMLFFGIRPIKVDQNPWVPWDSQTIQLESTIRTEDKLYKVTRKLASRPLCQISDENYHTVENIGNKSLPFIGQISKEKYQHLFHLKMEDLFFIHQKTWDDIEEDLLMRYDEVEINKPSELIKDIDDELQKIWKESNRGNNKIKAMEKSKFELLKKLKHLELQMKQKNDLDKELYNKNEELQLLRNQLKEKNLLLEEARLYEPIEESRMRIMRLQQMINPLKIELNNFKYMDEYKSLEIHQKEIMAIKKEKVFLEKSVGQEREKIEFQLNQTFHMEVPFRFITQVDLNQYDFFRETYGKKDKDIQGKDQSKLIYFGLLVAVSIAAIVGIYADNTPLLWVTMLFSFSMIGFLQLKNAKNLKLSKMNDEIEIAKNFNKFFPDVEYEAYYLSEGFASRLTIFQKDIQTLYKNVARFNELKDRLTILKEEMKERREGFLYLGNDDMQRGIDIYENYLRMNHELTIEEKRLNEYKDKLILESPKWKALVEKSTLANVDKHELKKDIEAIEREKDSLSDIIREIERDINAISDIDQYNQYKESFERICEEIQGLKDRRNELILTKSIIQWTDVSFRKKHTPKIIKNAGEYLSLMTNGKYSKISIQDEDNEKSLVVWVDGGYRSPQNNLSQGTQNQLYLAFRLALIDDLNDEKYAMPIVLDEALINFDAQRYQACLKVLEKVSEKRQVFLLTCHPEIINNYYNKYMIKI